MEYSSGRAACFEVCYLVSVGPKLELVVNIRKASIKMNTHLKTAWLFDSET
jgi:hypothetical protein